MLFLSTSRPIFFLERVDGDRRGEQEALQRVAAGGEEVVFLRLGLDAFGDDGHAELLAHVDDVVDDDATARLARVKNRFFFIFMVE